jgi:two-component system chemotaxis response regulator CheB
MVRVLVVSGSPLVRTSLGQMVSSQDGLVVLGSASTSEKAVRQVVEERPDVVLLDVELEPGGPSETVRRIIGARTTAIVLVLSGRGVVPQAVLAGLESGAIDIFELPASPEMHASASEELGAKMRLLDGLDVESLWLRRAGRELGDEAVSRRLDAVSVGVPMDVGGADIVVIGASTGGPLSLERLLGELPPSFSAPVVVCQHLPRGFSSAMAERLDAVSPLDVRIASDEDRLRSGLALVVPAGRSGHFERRGRSVHIRLQPSPVWERLSPSIDTMMESAADVYGSRVLAVLLTGMSGDGAEGMLSVRRAGGHTVCEAESSTRVHGMCRDAVRIGAVAEEADLSRMARLIMLRAGSRS